MAGIIGSLSIAILLVTASDPRLIAQADNDTQARRIADAASREEAEVNRIAGTILADCGLRLPESAPDLKAFVKAQNEPAACDRIDVHWVSFPGQQPLWQHMVPVAEANKWPLPQTFTLTSRSPIKVPCTWKAYRIKNYDFLYGPLVVFGATKEGEIRGLNLWHDPRRAIVECPELFGRKSTAETKCGEFVVPEADVTVVMPRNPEVTQLVFFLRMYTAPGEWHLERLGALDLQ